MKIQTGALLVNNNTISGLYRIGFVVGEREHKELFEEEVRHFDVYWLPKNITVSHRFIDIVHWIANNSVQYKPPPK
jgi:hypothetical protein